MQQANCCRGRSSSFYVLLFVSAICSSQAISAKAGEATHDWSGYSAGIVMGSARTKADVHLDLPSAYVGPAGMEPQIDAASLVSEISPSSISHRNFSGGFQAGYSFQKNHLVWGGEAGLVLNGVKASDNVSGAGADDVPWDATVKTSVKADWMLTLLPRIGYATGKALIYATGGLAVADIKVSQSQHQLYATFGGYGLEVSKTKTQLGWTLGTGVEYALSPKWALKGEYLYTAFGKITANTVTTDEGSWSAYPVAGETFHHEFKVKTQAFNLGVNYKF